MEFVPTLALATLVWKFIDFLKAVANRNVNAAATQAIAWVSGVGAVLLFAQTQFAAAVEIGDYKLGDLSTWSLVVIGLLVSSLASAAVDAKKALDGTDSAAVGKLFSRETTD